MRFSGNPNYLNIPVQRALGATDLSWILTTLHGRDYVDANGLYVAVTLSFLLGRPAIAGKR